MLLCAHAIFSFSSLGLPPQGTSAWAMLKFVNPKTRHKFVITGSSEKVCESLGWKPEQVEEAGGIDAFVHSHETMGTSLMIA
jgi:hypothetical protein